MLTPRKGTPRRTYTDSAKASYVSEAIQSGNHAEYCPDKNIPYTTFKQWLAQYQQSTDRENWSPNSKKRLSHRVFTDSTEKTATELARKAL